MVKNYIAGTYNNCKKDQNTSETFQQNIEKIKGIVTIAIMKVIHQAVIEEGSFSSTFLCDLSNLLLLYHFHVRF